MLHSGSFLARSPGAHPSGITERFLDAMVDAAEELRQVCLKDITDSEEVEARKQKLREEAFAEYSQAAHRTFANWEIARRGFSRHAYGGFNMRAAAD